MRREGDDFLFIHSNGNDQILIKNVFAMDASHYSELFNSCIYSGQMVGQVAFADGTVWDWKQLKQHTMVSYANDYGNELNGWDGKDIIYGSAEGDYIYGWGGNDIIYGSEGDDTIDGGTGSNELYGGAGDDLLTIDMQSRNNILAGGCGNDILQGGFYDDTYVFNRGDGQDTIIEHGYDYYLPEVPLDDDGNVVHHSYEDNEDTYNDEINDLPWKDDEWDNESDSCDKLVFGEGISAKDLWFEQQDQNLIVKIIGTDDQVLIENWYEGKGYRIEEFHTADGQVLLEAEVNKMVQAMAAFAPQAGGDRYTT